MDTEDKRGLADLKERLEFFAQMGVEDLTIRSRGADRADRVPPKAANTLNRRWEEMAERIRSCRKCPLAESRKNAVPGEGSLSAELMFIGEAPGRDEDIQGIPFVGRAGRLLTRIINAMTLERSDVFISNVIKCRPPDNRNPNRVEIAACQGYILEQIELIKPKVIVTLGNIPTQFFLKTTRGITALRGEFQTFQGIRVMPTFHPSYLVRNEADRTLRKSVWEDMKQVMAFLGLA